MLYYIYGITCFLCSREHEPPLLSLRIGIEENKNQLQQYLIGKTLLAPPFTYISSEV